MSKLINYCAIAYLIPTAKTIGVAGVAICLTGRRNITSCFSTITNMVCRIDLDGFYLCPATDCASKDCFTFLFARCSLYLFTVVPNMFGCLCHAAAFALAGTNVVLTIVRPSTVVMDQRTNGCTCLNHFATAKAEFVTGVAGFFTSRSLRVLNLCSIISMVIRVNLDQFRLYSTADCASECCFAFFFARGSLRLFAVVPYVSMYRLNTNRHTDERIIIPRFIKGIFFGIRHL